MLNRKFTGPLSLARWVRLVVTASYPIDQELDALFAASEYIEWLDSLPLTTERN